MYELLNVCPAVLTAIPVVNPNSWKVSDFNPPIINNGSYTCVSKTNPNLSIFIPTTSYPSSIKSDGSGIINLFSLTTEGYVGLPAPKNYLIINGISGIITNLKIFYWGDMAQTKSTYHIASKVTLYPDDASIGTICTRSSSPTYTTYTMPKNVIVYKKLKFLFENVPSGDGGEALLHRIVFTIKQE
jgi:hypothetical protein